MGAMKYITILALLFFVGNAVAGPDFEHGQPLIENSKPSKRLRLAPFPELATSVMYADEGQIKNDNSPIFILYGGVGGKTSTFGLATSLAPIASKVLKLGGTFFAFQNPLYFNDHLPDNERKPIVDQFGTMEAQLNWMSESTRFVMDRIPSGQRHPIWIITRSSSTLVMGQMMDDYEVGKAHARFLGGVSRWIGAGVLGHSPKLLARWMGFEKTLLSSLDATDELVRIIQPKIFLPMTFASDDPHAQPRQVTNTHHPKISLTWGVHDPNADIYDQLHVVERFAALHPYLDITGIGMDTAHNPAAKIKYVDVHGQEVTVETMARFGPILKELLADTSPYSPGLRRIATPGFRDTQAFGRCRILAEKFR